MRILSLLLLALVSCGRYDVRPAPEPTVIPTPVPVPFPLPDECKKKVILALFGTPWCHYCHETMPAVQKELNKLPKETRCTVDFRLYVTTGVRPQEKPTDAVTIAYRDSMHLDAVAYSDPNWGMFGYWIGGSRAVPAGAVVAMDGKRVIQRFMPGHVGASDIVRAAVAEASK